MNAHRWLTAALAPGLLALCLWAGAARAAPPDPGAPVPGDQPGTAGQPAETKPAETKPAEAKPAEAKPVSEKPNPEPPKGPEPSPELKGLIEGVKAFYDGVKHMRADFRQVVKQKTFSRTRKASGTIEFQKPGKMRWVYARPDKILYVSDGDTLWTYQPEDALVYQAQIRGSRLYNALRFLFGMGDFEKVFDITMGPAHSPETAYLILTPKSGEQDYKELALVVDRKSFEIRESFLTDAVGNVTQYIFDGIDYETAPDEKDFQFTPPPGVTVQKL